MVEKNIEKTTAVPAPIQPRDNAGSNKNTVNTWKFYAAGKTNFCKNDSILQLKYYNNGQLIREDKVKLVPAPAETKSAQKTPSQSSSQNHFENILFSSQQTKDFSTGEQYNISVFKDKGLINNDYKTINGENVNEEFQHNPVDNTSVSKLKITDKSGKTLLNIERAHKKISENEYLSAINDQKYNIKVNDEKITVIHDSKAVTINLEKILPKEHIAETERNKLKRMLKQLPGDILLQVNREISEITYIKDSGFFFPSNDGVQTDESYTSFLHELGHAIDSRPSDKNSNTSFLSKDAELKKLFLQEKAAFQKMMPDEITELGKIFGLNKAQETVSQSGLEEFIAESYFIINSGFSEKSIYDREHDSMTNPRQHFLLQCFPKTIAHIGNKMTEYSQTVNLAHPRTLKEEKAAKKMFFTGPLGK